MSFDQRKIELAQTLPPLSFGRCITMSLVSGSGLHDFRTVNSILSVLCLRMSAPSSLPCTSRVFRPFMSILKTRTFKGRRQFQSDVVVSRARKRWSLHKYPYRLRVCRFYAAGMLKRRQVVKLYFTTRANKERNRRVSEIFSTFGSARDCARETTCFTGVSMYRRAVSTSGNAANSLERCFPFPVCSA